MIGPTEVMSPIPWYYTFLPLVIAAGVILGVLFFIALGFLMGRRAIMTIRSGGALTLTLASVLLLSGLWCMFLSPTQLYTETKENFYRRISINGLERWVYLVNVQEGNTLIGSVDAFRAGVDKGETFNVNVYDQDGKVIWYDINVTFSNFNIKVTKSGLHKVEVFNPNKDAAECYVQVTVSMQVIIRPLEPMGQWLSLVSLPIFGLGIWASGIFGIKERQTSKPSET